jgi:hypothetical protein
MVGLQTLDLPVGVRIPASQSFTSKRLGACNGTGRAALRGDCSRGSRLERHRHIGLEALHGFSGEPGFKCVG